MNTAFFINFAWKFFVVVFMIGLAERWSHKYILQGLWIYRHVPFLRYSYRQHMIEHHGQGHNKLRPHIHLASWDYWPALPFVLFGLVRWLYFGQSAGASGAAAIMTACGLHWYLWNRLHEAIHDIKPNSWIKRTPLYEAFRQNHLDHHLRPNTNYAVVCLWTDYIFGTKWRSE